MTISRAEILAEMGLAPQWVRRERPLAPTAATRSIEAQVEHDPAPAPLLEEPPPHMGVIHAPRGDADTATRVTRIAALTWGELAADVDACNACGLCRTRQRSVPGVGDTKAHWLFVGEAPGADEDARGEPFVGQAGRLLDNMLGALGMSRDRNVYIANVLKCRPPDNRTPEPLEAAACRPYLERQMALLQPKIIVALGKSAASLLLGTDATIGSLRGRTHDYGGVPLIVTYHPAYLLRTPTDKAKVWEDLLLARRSVAASAADDPAGTPFVA
ncbi:MAG: uracil-DNA glycosylase [Betaproteobacteria bacterium]